MPLSEKSRALRMGRIGASQVPDILGVGYRTADQSLAKMVAEYCGLESSNGTPNIAMEWGRLHEPEALDAYEDIRGLTFHAGVYQTTVIHPEYDWLVATPDAWTGQVGLVEIKCPYRAAYVTVQPGHWVQIQTQLAVTGQEYCDWVCYRPGEPLIVQTVYPEPGVFEEWLPALKDFHQRFLEAV